MRVPYVTIATIQQHTQEALWLYQRARKTKNVFPLEPEDLFERLFGLPTIYDDRGLVNEAYGKGIVGCLFPDGQPSPWGRDKLIVVNQTRTCDFDPTKRSAEFTVLHEGMGHYILHHLKGITGERLQRAVFCRDIGPTRRRKPSLEWQADRAAAELMMPVDRVTWLLDGKQPPEMINLDLYERHMMEYFGANASIVKVRLKELGYKLFSTRPEWVDWRQDSHGGSRRVEGGAPP